MLSIIDLDEKASVLITIVILSLVFGSHYLIRGDLNMYLLLAVVASIAVIPHEYAHKLVAIKMGCISRYVLDPVGLIITLISAIPYIPFKIIAPGYTLVSIIRYDPHYVKRLNGIVSFAGPLTNVFISALSLSILVFLHRFNVSIINPYILVFLKLNAYWNSWVALFNLLPIPPLDGSKVITWKPHLWLSALLLSTALYLLSSM